MKKMGQLLAVVLLAGNANAAIVDAITGADMAGIQVTAFFEDGSEETVGFVTTNADATVPDGEGFSGAASGAGWSLAQQGFTLGNFGAGGAVLGAWTLSNTSGIDMTGVTIDALAGGIVFDILGLQTGDSTEYTPGSGVGRGFQSELNPTIDGQIASYANPVSLPDLWGSLNIDFAAANTVLASGNSLRFLSDTDSIISLPAPVALFLVGAVGLLRKQSGRRV